MNKLGFYTKNFTPAVIEAIKMVKPPTLLTQLDDISVLEDMRRGRSPDTFVVGRFHFPIRNHHPMLKHTEGHILEHEDPEEFGHILAKHCIEFNFGLGTRRVNDRLLIDAWMTLNEAIPGPASEPWQRNENNEREKYIRHAQAYDTLQVAFLETLQEKGLQAVAFNFAAGNWMSGEDYLTHFPKTLEAYTYLGFHEYAWPHMDPTKGKSACGSYREIMKPIQQKYGSRHKVIMTEAGLARAYATGDTGDVGWLHREELEPGVFRQAVSKESYTESLHWYNRHLMEDDYVVGACLFQMGAEALWETFEQASLIGELHQLAMALPADASQAVA